MRRICEVTTLFVLTLALTFAGASVASAAPIVKKGAFYKVEISVSGKGDSKVAKIKVTGVKGYHCNLLYPWKLTFEAPEGVTFEKAKYKAGPKIKKDATAYGEDAIVFTVPYKASAGAGTINAKLKLSLCDDKQCQMETVSISWKA